MFGAFIYKAFTPLALSEAVTVNAVLVYFPVVDVEAPLIVGALPSILNSNEPLKLALHPAREFIGPPPLPEILTVYVPSVKPLAVAFFEPEPTLLDALQTENETLFDVTLTVTAYNYTGNDNYKKAARRSMLTRNFRPTKLYGLQI